MGDKKVRVAIVGVGNCAAALVQGVQFYKDAPDDQFISGLMHARLGDYHVGDIEITAGFDIDSEKVGKDLSQAIWSGPNNTIKFADVPHMGVPVYRGMTHDGLGRYLKQRITKAPGPTDDIVGILKDTKTDVVINFLPVGSEMATKWYVQQILDARCGMVNCIPVFIARESYWQARFKDRRLPVVGDDIKSQVGATITHRVLTNLFRTRGVRLDNTYQLNFGGNMDFFNMLERDRLESKKVSKTNAVTSQLGYERGREELEGVSKTTSLADELGYELGADNVHVGPSDYVPWMTDRKFCYIQMDGTTFGDVPLKLELKLEVWDSPNSAGVVIDAVRCCKIAMDRGLSGAIEAPSAYFMKSPPAQYTDDEARLMVEAFVADEKTS